MSLRGRLWLSLGVTAGMLLSLASTATAGGIYGNNGLFGGYRWDAAVRNGANFGTIIGDSSQSERSLVGGLRYSVQGGSYEAFRDLFSWDVVPEVDVFQQTVEQAFAAWTAVDPATGLGTSLSFVADFGTQVVGTGGSGINIAGAEIDLFGTTDGDNWDFGSTGLQGEAGFYATGDPVTLTSGTQNYQAGAIVGADIKINSNRGAVYNIDVFRLLLTHEIGHTLGFADVDVQSGPAGNFIDDNYSSAAPEETLNNSWAGFVNVYNPAASTELELYTVDNGDPGTKTNGVNILMESQGLGGQLGNLTPLSNDDYGIRQFLYPTIAAATPEPATVLLALPVLGMFGAVVRRGRVS